MEAEERRLEEQERRLEGQERRKIRERELRRRQRAQKAKSFMKKVRTCAVVGTMAAMLMVIGYLVYVIMQPVPPVSVATLTGGIDVRWSNPDLSTELGSPLRPGSIKLVEGTAEITFDEGARIVIEAPAEINLENSNRAFLHLGKLSAEVPVQARGFKINTPNASITDLGTEFGVRVAEDGTSDIYVLKGKVSLLAGKVGERVGKLFDAVEQIVEAGQAKRVKTGSSRIENIQFEQKKFIRDMPSQYELAILKANPAVYWRFNQDSKYIDGLKYFGNAGIEANGPELGDAKANNVLKLDGQNSYVLGKDKFENWAQSGFSQVLWVRPDAVTRQNIILNADNEGPYSNYSRQLFVNSQGNFSFWILVSEARMPEGSPVTLTGSTTAQPGKWYHVAVTVAANGDMRLFVNGIEESKLSLDDQFLHFDRQRNRIYIGSAACGVMDDREPMNSFKGALDEVARYNRPLAPEEIKQLYSRTITEYMR
jgi:hypothetical protein